MVGGDKLMEDWRNPPWILREDEPRFLYGGSLTDFVWVVGVGQ